MLFHLTQFIDHGIIDNRTPGNVELSLWIKGEEYPVVFNLTGDCLRDIAGCRLEFRLKNDFPESEANPFPSFPERTKNAPPIPGQTGDMTGSKRSISEKDKKTILNSLYLEWFTDESQGFLIDSNQWSLCISPPEWIMDECDEQAQIMSNQQTLRDYILNWICNYSNTPTEPNPLPDHPWDKRLREAEGISFVYQEIHKKYAGHPSGEIAEAFVMGWDSHLDKMAESDESGTIFSLKIRGPLNIFDILNKKEEIEVKECMSNPLFQQVISFTEYMHSLFSEHFEGKNPPYTDVPEGVLGLFETIRYVTPNILSCLLQANLENANYSLLTERITRCTLALEQSLASIKKNFAKSKLEKMLEDLYLEIVATQQEFAKQVKH